MSFGTYETPKPPTAPTFSQFIKTCGKGVEGKTKFAVDIVWFPGQFDNLTLQTHAFRYICDSSHPLYTEFQKYVLDESTKDSSPRIDIVISSIENRTISVFDNSKQLGKWEKLGKNAYRFKTS